jgi:hypothetical protein
MSMSTDLATEIHKPGSDLFVAVMAYFMRSYSRELNNNGLKYMWPTCVEVNLNRSLYYQTMGMRLMLDQLRACGSRYELMFHGFTTGCKTWTALMNKKDAIFHKGFDASMNKRFAFGHGCYFAKNAGYSVDGYMPSCTLDKSQCDKKYGFDTINKGGGEREVTCILLVRVLKGQTKNADSRADADSSVNYTSSETMSIVKDSDKMFPEFALYFEGVKDFRYSHSPPDKF